MWNQGVLGENKLDINVKGEWLSDNLLEHLICHGCGFTLTEGYIDTYCGFTLTGCGFTLTGCGFTLTETYILKYVIRVLTWQYLIIKIIVMKNV